METWLSQLAAQSPYIAIVGVLLLTGLGLPLPEDIPLILAGYLCGEGYANLWIMLPACFLAILAADGTIFFLGRRYGHHVPRMPLLRRFLTEPRLGKTEQMLHRHGGKFIFMARFLPGLRTAAFFTGGVFKLPYWKFVLYDGAAAVLSVPTIFLVAYYFADQLDLVKQWVKDGQLIAIILLILALVAAFFFERLFKRAIKRRFLMAMRKRRERSRPRMERIHPASLAGRASVGGRLSKSKVV